MGTWATFNHSLSLLAFIVTVSLPHFRRSEISVNFYATKLKGRLHRQVLSLNSMPFVSRQSCMKSISCDIAAIKSP